jgi:hypothetical protein
MSKLKRMDPNKTSCPVEGCKIPRGIRGEGLIPGAGVAMHVSRYHKDFPTLTDEDKEAVELREAASKEHAEGDKVVVGQAIPWVEDLANVLHAPTNPDGSPRWTDEVSGQIAKSTSEGVVFLPRVPEIPGTIVLAARQGRVFAWLGEWTEFDLDTLIQTVKVAVWASR